MIKNKNAIALNKIRWRDYLTLSATKRLMRSLTIEEITEKYNCSPRMAKRFKEGKSRIKKAEKLEGEKK